MRTEKCCHIYEHKCCRFSDENLRFIALWTIQKFCSRTPCGMIKQELLLPFIGGVFVIEAVSVILQVGSYKLRKKRIFKMAPLHHHFELMGWSESKIIVRFWISSLIFALFALTTLKLR